MTRSSSSRLDGGEARRLTDLPRGIDGFEWSPDGTRLVVVTASHGATRTDDDRRRGIDRKAESAASTPPPSDYRFVDRLDYMLNGSGFTYDKVGHLWLVDAATGEASRLTDGRAADGSPAWSPDGRRIAFTSNRRRNADLVSERLDIHVVDVDTKAVTAVTRGPRSMFFAPTWLPDGATIAALGHRMEGGAGSRNDIWLFAADGSDATPTGGRNISATHDLMPGSGMSSDLTRGEGARLIPSKGGRWLAFTAPIDGSYELWRIAVADGRLERLTNGRQYISGWDGVPHGSGSSRVRRIAYLRSTPTAPPDLWLLEVQGGSSPSKPRRLTRFNAEVLDELALHQPVERHVTVDGRDIQGWFDPRRRRPAAARRPDPRRAAHALRLVAVVGVPAPRRRRDERLLLQPARLRGLRRGVQRRQPPRLGTRPESRRPGRCRCPRGRRPGGPGTARSHRRLLRRLPHQLDRRPRSSASARR